MTAKLDWRQAVKGDRGLIESFHCCSPRKAPPSSPRFEELVERLIHSQKPPGSPDRGYRLGFADDDLAAVVIVDDLREGAEFFHIAIIAVSSAYRRSGLHLGDEALEHASSWVAHRAREKGLSTAIVTANIHVDNGSSMKCFERAGFTRDPAGLAGDYQQWILVLEL